MDQRKIELVNNFRKKPIVLLVGWYLILSSVYFLYSIVINLFPLIGVEASEIIFRLWVQLAILYAFILSLVGFSFYSSIALLFGNLELGIKLCIAALMCQLISFQTDFLNYEFFRGFDAYLSIYSDSRLRAGFNLVPYVDVSTIDTHVSFIGINLTAVGLLLSFRSQRKNFMYNLDNLVARREN